ncbi:MAG: hypothetical protein ABWZ41_09845 [Burkholderiales bacterium]
MTAFRCFSDGAARIAATLVLVFAATSACAQAPASEIATPDPRITSTARLLAGVGSGYEPHAHVAALDAWAKHRATLAPQWERLRRERLSVIEGWRDDVLGAELDRCRTLLYPFSGPDFLNAYLLFPRCDTYVFFGLERPGEVPPLEAMSRDDATALLRDVRVALGDILVRNYFITEHMARELHTPRMKGMLPLMLASMGLLDVRIAAVEPFDLGRTAGPLPNTGTRASRRAHGVKVTFVQPLIGKPQTLYYLSLDATDAALRANPEFLPFLAQHNPSLTFLKSASYLLHGNEFAGTRRTLLEVSELVVQDDTGIPYRFLRERGFEVRLFGRYARPIKDFNYGYQKDLAAAYQQVGNVSILPFPFGYHWQQGRSGLMVARSTAKRS